ncbi:MAG: hypothetical protein KGJ35_02405 [Patescibacteria group bacterium]|nr:hypothetical protein [Patescibacteria group bacterium]
MAKKTEKKQNISINTEEPIEEKDFEIKPIPEEDEDETDDENDLDEDEVDPFGDKWEQ